MVAALTKVIDYKGRNRFGGNDSILSQMTFVYLLAAKALRETKNPQGGQVEGQKVKDVP
jgi:hypothetical protein